MSYIGTTDRHGSLGIEHIFDGCCSCSFREDQAARLVALRVALEHRDEGGDPYSLRREGLELGECRKQFLLVLALH